MITRLPIATHIIMSLEIQFLNIKSCQKYAKQVILIVHCHHTEKNFLIDSNHIHTKSYRFFIIQIQINMMILIIEYMIISCVTIFGVEKSMKRNPSV